MPEPIQPIKSEVTSIALDTLANIIAEKTSENAAAQKWITQLRQQVTNLEKEKLDSYWQGYSAAQSIPRPQPHTDGEIATATRNSELVQELKECRGVIEVDRELAADLRKQLEFMGQRNCNLHQETEQLENEIKRIRSVGRYHDGHVDGFASALGKAQDAILKLRK